LLFILLFAGTGECPKREPDAIDCVAEKYDGKQVKVEGYLDMTRERDLLYVHKVDSDNVLLSNSIWVHRSERMGADRRKINQRYVKIVGRFKVGFSEHLGNPPNGIDYVVTVDPWSDPTNPLKERLNTLPGVTPDR